MYRLVALDLDGTLLDSRKEVPEENIRAVRAAADGGTTVVICSGRPYRGARIFMKQLGITGPLIGCNGAIIRNFGTEEILREKPMSPDSSIEVSKLCKEEDIYHHAYVGDAMYTGALGHGSVYYSELNSVLAPEDRFDIRVEEELWRIFCGGEKGAYKFYISDPEREVLARLRTVFAGIPDIDVVSSYYDNIEVVKKGVCKGEALKFLADTLGVAREEVLAIGDNENDLSMLEYAGMGVAMGNAEKPAKEIADFITLDNNRCGVAEAIKKFVL